MPQQNQQVSVEFKVVYLALQYSAVLKYGIVAYIKLHF